MIGLWWLRLVVLVLACGNVLQAAAAGPAPRDLEWDALMPPGWDPLAEAPAIEGLDGLEDDDPKAAEAMEQMRRVWSQAPPNKTLDGQLVRLPGFIVPLETKGESVVQFLLVPYYGACIHTPPPPANQMVMITPDIPVSMDGIYDPIWVTGTLKVERSDNEFGGSAYTIRGGVVAPYQP